MTRKGYILPDNHEPDGYYCLTVHIPRDVAYLRAFFGALDFMGKWLAWDDGGDGRAKEAADVWKVANELTHQLWALCPKGNEGGMCCDDGSLIPPPFSEGSNPNGAEDAAANVINGILKPLAAMAADYCDDSEAAFIAAAQAYMRQFNAGYTAPATLASIYQQVCALTEPEREALQGDAIYCDAFEELSQCADVNGVWDVLDCLNELLVNWLDAANDSLMDALNAAAAALGAGGLQAAAGYGGAGGGAGFETACNDPCGGDWTALIDFTTGGTQGWAVENKGTFAAGWLGDTIGYPYWSQPYHAIPVGCTILSLEVELSYPFTPSPPNDNIYWAWHIDGGASYGFVSAFLEPVEGVNWVGGCLDVPFVGDGIKTLGCEVLTYVGQHTQLRFRIKGTGINPF